MDDARFDAVVRKVGEAMTRRGALAGLVGGLLMSVLAGSVGDAKGRRRDHHRKADEARRGGQHDTHRGSSRRSGDIHAEKKKKKCKAGTVKCGKACITTKSDPRNCGRCGNACVAGQSCLNGACTCDGAKCAGCCEGATCQAGTRDAMCGIAGAVCVACTGGRTCQNGVCACPTGLDVCDDACVDLSADERYCGDCGRVCATTQTCLAGVCGESCGAGGFCAVGSASPDCCGEICTDKRIDENNCGECARTCASGEGCHDGACGCGNGGSCAEGETCCSDTCRNLQTAFANCGTCGNACSNLTANQCLNGACKCGAGSVCPAGQRCCGGVCKSVATDMNNCGACGVVCNSTTANNCSSGVCRCGSGAACPNGYTCCNGACRNLSADFNLCGASCAAAAACNSVTANNCSSGVCKCGAGSACSSGQRCCGGTCKTVTNDVLNCGACGAVCPGYGQTTTNVSCQNSVCTFSCKGDYYDVDNNPANGCESQLSNARHTAATAYSLGSHRCFDDEGGYFTGTMVSDARVHENPGLSEFSTYTGAAPQYWVAYASGGSCSNDPSMTISMPGALNGCYQLTFFTDKGSWSTGVTNGQGAISLGSGSYTDGTNVTFKVEKICSIASAREARSYSVTYHL